MRGFRADVYYKCPVCHGVHSENDINTETVKQSQCDNVGTLLEIQDEVQERGYSSTISLVGIDLTGDAFCPTEEGYSRIKFFRRV